MNDELVDLVGVALGQQATYHASRVVSGENG